MYTKIAAATLLCAVAACWLYPAAKHTRPEPAAAEAPGHPQTELNTRGRAPVAVFSEQDDVADTEMVLGIRVRKDRNCDVELRDYVTPQGEMFSAYSCTPREAKTPHPLAGYGNDTLAQMAYGDAEAAAELGRRLIRDDTPRAYRMLVRASALDGGSVTQLDWLADQAFGAVSIDGKPQLGNLRRRYELAVVAARLGDVSGRADYYRSELVRHGASDRQISVLDRRAAQVLQYMRDVQRTVLGEVTIGGQGDA